MNPRLFNMDIKSRYSFILLILLSSIIFSSCSDISNAWWVTWGGDNEIEFNKNDIQATIEKNFPISIPLGIFDLAITNPQISLNTNSNKIEARFNLYSDDTRRENFGIVKVMSSIRYDSKNCSFFLDQLSIDTIKLNGIIISNQYVLNKIANKIVSSPIDTVTLKKHGFCRKVSLKSVKVKNENDLLIILNK